MYHAICILEEGLRGCNVSMRREGSAGFEVNQWHQGLGDGGIDEMDMAGSVLGASPSLMWQRSDIIIVVNDGRFRCCGFLECCWWWELRLCERVRVASQAGPKCELVLCQ